jgi:glycosyltransferase involved in cell wall biosynthesis
VKKVLIIYNWFLPAFKAGGPIQSLANLVRQTSDQYEYYIVCSNNEYHEHTPLKNIVSDKWLNFESKASVYYLSAASLKPQRMRQIIRQVKPDIVFTNGMYSVPFGLYPICFSSCKTVFSARGMFHPGALSQKAVKKKIFLYAFKKLGLHKKVIFHATDENEKEYIWSQFGNTVKVNVAGNFPQIQDFAQSPPKQTGNIIMGSISLISPMKNHLLVLESLRYCTSKVTYYIYGPVKDQEYWTRCQAVIRDLPNNIQVEYKGEVPPTEVRDVLKEFHYFILPSKSENFGHAIFEALTAGKPVITSFFTPWNNLESRRAGYNVDISNVASITDAIEKAAAQNVSEYLDWRQCSRSLAIESVNLSNLREQYQQLFDVAHS